VARASSLATATAGIQCAGHTWHDVDETSVMAAHEGKIHRVDPDFGSTLTVSNRDYQSKCWVNWKIMGRHVSFRLWQHGPRQARAGIEVDRRPQTPPRRPVDLPAACARGSDPQEPYSGPRNIAHRDIC
jgi:hypothetical protein